MAKRLTKRYVYLGTISVMLVLYFQYLSLLKSPLALPIKKQETCTSQLKSANSETLAYESGCDCSLLPYTYRGFPFEENLYDYCRQDDTTDIRIVLLNIFIQLGATTTLLVIGNRLLTKYKHKT